MSGNASPERSGADGLWWHTRNADLAEVRSGSEIRLLPDRVCRLLDDVEAAFAITGADTPGWAGRPMWESPAEDEYSHCADPDKFRIIPARIEAWVEVLLERGWARRTDARADGWPEEVEESTTTTTTTITLTPSMPGAVPVVFTIYDSADPDATLNVEISAGNPHEALIEVPGCGCDACDSGSARLLEELDQWVLSVVDGSLVVDSTAQLQVRTSFGGHGQSSGRGRGDGRRRGGGQRGNSPERPVVVAGPWADGWTPMQVIDGDRMTGFPAPDRGLVTRFRDLVRGVGIRLRRRPQQDRGWTVYSRPADD